MDSDSRFEVSPDVRYRVVEGEAVVLRQGPGEVLILNEVGARVLQLMDQGLSIGAAASRLLEEYDVAEEVVRDDLERFVDEAVTSGLLRRVSHG